MSDGRTFYVFDPLQPLFGISVPEDGDGQLILGSAVCVFWAHPAFNAYTFALAKGANILFQFDGRLRDAAATALGVLGTLWFQLISHAYQCEF